MVRPGSYKEPLVCGLRAHNPVVAQKVIDGDVKIAVASSITGSVVVRRDLTELFISALRKSGGDQEVVDHYVSGLGGGRFVPAVSTGVYVYPDGEAPPVVPEKEYAPGELFFKS